MLVFKQLVTFLKPAVSLVIRTFPLTFSNNQQNCQKWNCKKNCKVVSGVQLLKNSFKFETLINGKKSWCRFFLFYFEVFEVFSSSTKKCFCSTKEPVLYQFTNWVDDKDTKLFSTSFNISKLECFVTKIHF